jgi:hypothetical protein
MLRGGVFQSNRRAEALSDDDLLGLTRSGGFLPTTESIRLHDQGLWHDSYCGCSYRGAGWCGLCRHDHGHAVPSATGGSKE